MDKMLIPVGSYCYSGGTWDSERGIYVTKPCPYWQATNYGTVKCSFLNEESLTPEAGSRGDTSREKAYRHFGGVEATWTSIDEFSLLWDQVKECGENYGDEEEEE